MYIIVAWWLKFQKRLNIGFWEAIILAITHCVTGVIAMRLWAIIEAGVSLSDAPNLRIYGALFLQPPCYYLWAKLRKKDISLAIDAATVVCLIAWIPGRFNCILQGCCDGICIFPGSDIHWPLREMEILWSILYAIIFGKKVLNQKTYGQGFGSMLLSYGVFRFAIEWLREEYTGQLGVFHLAHIWSLLAMAIGAVMLYKVRKQIQPGGNRRNDAKSKNLAKGGK